MADNIKHFTDGVMTVAELAAYCQALTDAGHGLAGVFVQMTHTSNAEAYGDACAVHEIELSLRFLPHEAAWPNDVAPFHGALVITTATEGR